MADIASLVHQTSSTTGTGDLTVAAVDGKRTFDEAFGHVASPDVFFYFIASRSEAEWEIGTGSMSDATTLVRDTVLHSSNSDLAVNFSAGTKDVANDIPAEFQVQSGDVILNSLLTTRGDIIRRGATDPERLALGTTGHVYQSDGTDVVTGQLTAAAFPTGAPVITTAMISATDTDGTLAGNSDTKFATQKATKTYADTKVLKTDLASTANAKGASLVGIEDSGTLITATTVEGALAEIATAVAGKQASDSDLTSWAGVTRASGFDTFAATPSQANFKSLLTDEPLGSSIGGTGNAFTKFTGPTTSEKTFTLPDSSQALACLDLADQTITGGARVTSLSDGTKSSGTYTPDPGDRPLIHITNGGAFTLAPGSNTGAYLLDITNNGSAGAITTSGWTKKAGDSFDTTNGHIFRCHCSIGNGGSLLVVQAMF